MASESQWAELSLGDVLELKRGYDLPKDKRRQGVVPIVSSSGISDYHSDAMVGGPGVVTGRYGTIGDVFFVDEDFWPLNTTLYVRDFKGNDPRFVSYLLKTIDFQAYSDKGAVPGVNRNHLHLAKVKIPSYSVQTRIAEILSAFDSKIELSRECCALLEGLAQAIFKSWFVDFDPVKAKIAALQEGCDPLRAAMSAISGKSDDELDALPNEQRLLLASYAQSFPESMMESDLGEIPTGWNVQSIRDLARFPAGKATVSKLSVDNYVSTESMIENRGGIQSASSLPSSEAVPSFSAGHVLVSNIRPYFKKIWLATFDGGRSPDVLAFEAIHPRQIEYTYHLLSQDGFFEFMTRTAKGAKMPRGDKDAIMGWRFSAPADELREGFSSIVRPFHARAESLRREIDTLKALRDALLPKLLSGEIAVKDSTDQLATAKDM